MTTSPESPRPDDGAPRPGLLESVAPYFKLIAYLLCGLFAVLAVVAVVLVVRSGWAKAFDVDLMVDLMLAAAALIVAGFAVYQAGNPQWTEVQKTRLLLLLLGATFGLAVALIGLALPFFHRFGAVFAGGGEAWRKDPLKILIPMAAFVAGLALAFFSLQLGRGQERESAGMRRLLYGFNAVFSTLLLAAILLLVNVLPYLPQLGAHDFIHSFLGANFDWTQSRIYSLSDRTKNTLSSLKQPVKVYVLLDNNDPLTEQVLTLLQNCQALDPTLTWEQISSLSARIQELPQKLREKITDSHGLLVVYGDEAQAQAQFIRRDKLFTTQPDETGAGLGKVLFQGEGALLQTIRSLTENAEKKPVVYFTQGDGELDFNNAQEDSTDGVGFAVKLMRRTEVYDLKDLTFGGDSAAVPADADAVVVARPGKMKPAALKALCNYMGYDYDEAAKAVRDLPAGQTRKAGKLFVLLDVQVQDKQMLQTGLEPLLQKFGAQPGQGRILSLQDPTHPTDIDAAMNRSSRNPVAKAFAAPNRVIFHFTDARSMKRSPAPPGGPFAADELLVTESDAVWEEADLVAPPTTLAAAHFKGPFSDEPISLAVAVSESKGDMPNDAAHAGLASEGRPRLVAFGNAAWIANGGLLNAQDAEAKYHLFTSCLSWLREKSDVGAGPVEADETKARIPFHPTISDDTALTMQFLPLAQMTLAVIAGGIGVWLVRRR